MSILSRLTFSTVLIATFLMGQTAWATTYYVDRLLPGKDSNNGTAEATPFLTIRQCVDVAVNPGDTCLVKNGTYLNEGEISIKVGGTSGNPITLKNYPGHTPKIQWSDKTNPANRILMSPGTTVCNTAPPGFYVIEGLELANAYNGVKIDCGHDVIIRNNHIHDTWYPGINVASGFNVKIDRNIIHHMGDFTGAAGTGGLPHTHCLYLTGKGYSITNNLIYDCYLYGINIAGYSFGTFAAPNNNYAGFQGLIANNTVAYTVTRGGLSLWNPGGGVSATIENNIFYQNSQSESGSAQGIQYVSCNSCTGTVRNNLYFGTGNSTGFSVSSGSNPPAGVTVSGTINVNPLMINAPATLTATPDFNLTSGSGAIDYGLDLRSVGITSDFKGLPRPQGAAFDVGAHEFSDDINSPSAPQGLQVQ